MDIWHILAIILFTMQVVVSLFLSWENYKGKLFCKSVSGDCLECNFI